jgi:hypothetical protein
MLKNPVAQAIAGAVGCFVTLAALAGSTAPAPTSGDAALIKSAERAAPRSISAKATIITMDAAGKMRTIRTGSNGWTCMPDNPATPGPDAMCWDKNSGEWMDALMAHKPPPAKVGLMYMLAGGTDASNTDPFAQKPAAGGHWIKTGPHVMIVGADESFYSTYPRGADPDTSVPYVMWSGTPYQHLMAPVK